ncbi:MAG: isoprenylcysteine carboxylmethyltransferase family protein [Candidatus Krumholzibacteriia bacterium]
MDPSIKFYLGFLFLLYAERLVELAVSRRNERRMRAAGGRELGRRHFPALAILHGLFPAASAAEVVLLDRVFPGVAGWLALAAALGAQALRWWAVATLGPAWSVRIMVPARPRPVTAGPYRYLRHPNYLAVIVEIAAVPLVHGAWITAATASLVNAALLRVRIRTEERALGPSYAQAFTGRRRLVPRRPS